MDSKAILSIGANECTRVRLVRLAGAFQSLVFFIKIILQSRGQGRARVNENLSLQTYWAGCDEVRDAVVTMIMKQD